MNRKDFKYKTYLHILREELIPATGCTEPIAISYGASKAREVLGNRPDRCTVEASGNIIKNAKSVVVPNTGGLKGIAAAAAAGFVAGDASKGLDVLDRLTDCDKSAIREYLKTSPIEVLPLTTDVLLDFVITVHHGQDSCRVRIQYTHTNIVHISKNGRILFQTGNSINQKRRVVTNDRSLLNVEDICGFASSVDINDVSAVMERQIACNTAVAEEGLKNVYGANIGRVLLSLQSDLQTRAKALAAAGSDARMGGCEMPVIINSGSGNQGLAVSLPVIEYARDLRVSHEKLIRALVLSNLIAIHQKTGIGRLSAFCGAVSAGAAAGCGIAFLNGGGFICIAHTLVNALAITSGIVCDGAKPSCAAKIAAGIDAGILGYQMYLQGQEFKGGDGLILKGVENTLRNIARLGKIGMKETDTEIIKMMTDC